MSERKFTRALGKPGMAAQLRETVSQVVRESAVQSKLHLVDPIDFESFVTENKTLLHNDSQRELLLYPIDDVKNAKQPREYRTTICTAPTKSQLEDANLFTKECIKSYFSDWNLIHYKYSAYSGSYLDLPYNSRKILKDESKDEVYEIDVEVDQVDEDINHKNGITKEGYLMKGPEVGVSDRIMFSNIGSKSFKKRFCHLRQQVDGTYILEFCKDEKKSDVKIANLDFCTEIVRNQKRGKYCFELKMNGPHKSYVLGAENEEELQDWITKLNTVIQHYKQQEETQAALLEKTNDNISTLPQANYNYGTLKGLEQSMNPQLIKYSQETDTSISLARRKNRKLIFQMYLHTQHGNKSSLLQDNDIKPYKEQFNQRILIKCESIKFKLLAHIDEKESLCQVEPYFATLSIFDARNHRKLSENFYFDINHESLNTIIQNKKHEENSSDDYSEFPDELKNIPISWLNSAKQAIFNVSNPHPDIFLVVRIDKILQGSINQTCEPYVRATKDPSLGIKIRKQVQAYSQRVGNYKMPFAWSTRPLFRLYSNELDTTSDFSVIYRQEGSKIKDEELLKLLSEYRKPDKLNKLTVIPGTIKINIEAIIQNPENSLTTTLVPVKPFPKPTTSDLTLEIAEFESSSEKDVHPFTSYINHLFVYPQSLMFDTQKLFNRARNIACCIEIRDNDIQETQSLKYIYGRPGASSFVSKICCSVLHHNTTPSWYEEVKIKLPLKLHTKHHLLFTFYHISCNLNKKKENGVENCLGFAWLPLLSKGRLTLIEESKRVLPIATNLPDGYLSVQPLGLGKGNAGPDIIWIDSQKPIFTVTIQIHSTVFTKDLHLHNLFAHAEKIMDSIPISVPSDSESCKILKSAHAIQLSTAISFLPTIFNQLLTLLTCNLTDEVGQCAVRLLIHLVNFIHEAGRQEILLAYVKYVFLSPTNKSNNTLTVHEQLVKFLPTLFLPNNMDLVLLHKFMVHSSLFFDIIVKSMAQYLLFSGRIKMHRSERFSKQYQEKVELFVQVTSSHLANKCKEVPHESHALNKSLAQFLKRCLTFMDRGLTFKLISACIDKFAAGSSRLISDLKFNFLQIICTHEHFISFNLPMTKLMSPTRSEPVNDDYYLSENFCKYHFLVGLLLQQVKVSLDETVPLRKVAVSILRDLLAKHELDDRYQINGRMSRIASLYIPWISILLENFDRLESVSNMFENEIQDLTDAISLRTRGSIYMGYQDINSKSNSRLSGVNNISALSSTPIKLSHRGLVPSEIESSPIRNSTSIRDSTYLAAIAGHGMVDSHSCSIESDLSNTSTVTQINNMRGNNMGNGDLVILNDEMKEHKEHSRSVNLSRASTTSPRCDKFQSSEVQDLLICFMFVVKHLDDKQIISYWQQCTDIEIQKFLSIIELSLHHFKYQGRRQSSANIVQEIGKPKTTKSMTLPARMFPPDFSNDNSPATGTLQPQNTTAIRENLLEHDSEKHYYKTQANLSVEIGLIVLDCLGLFCLNFKDLLVEANSSNPITHQIINIYLTFLRLGQSENLYHHVFAALRAFLNNYSITLFQGNGKLCGRLCYELLRCCNSKLSSIRQESCALLYLLMRSNFEFTSRKGLTRVHLQVMISVSQMLGNIVGLNNLRFQESLSLINSYACSDKVMKGTSFPLEVQDLNKRIRTVLMATAQMKEHNNDPEMLLDLKHSLANSYASTPELRHTWLETMARNHMRDGNYSEAACCQLHIAALMAEYLKLNKLNDWGAEAFEKISKNIPRDEKGLKLDAGVQDVHYNDHVLLEQLESCAELLDKAERFELLGHLYRLIIPIYEKKRNYQALANCYSHLTQAYNKVVQVNKNGKRLLGRYYKVAFFGSGYFEQEHGIEYIYKEPKLTTLPEISERLRNLYAKKFGAENVKIMMDSTFIQMSDLDPKIAYIQVTYVVPYFDDVELENRLTDFERNHDISCFMFETPFTQDGNRTTGKPEDQWKRRTIVTTEYSFPYAKKRIQVIHKKIIELSPIQVALDEMRQRVQELQDVAITSGTCDAKKLQLKLQGSICVTVNAGPLAYANAFLNPPSSAQYPDDLVQELKDVFKEFVKICYTALQINSKLISCDQHEYQEALRENFQKFCQNLSSILGEPVWPNENIISFKRNSAALFNAISGTTSSHSSTA
ncbi:dedicator of cytokinesis protein 9 isoform X2 [Phymastichus coffea]|uniref:dedicator of cytokinesis protein 9 isoform X2 n=1 Tax=Phymastichus coffea TaxID=108790 RepID=UPI00273C473F|nr:dedicator of cytokinesis protein 9 isoform X2 [Phymastichus coffea]